MNRSVLGLTTVLLMSALIIGGCGSNQDDHVTSLKVRTITIGEEAGTTNAGYSGTIKNRTETNLAFQVGGRVINKFVLDGITVACAYHCIIANPEQSHSSNVGMVARLPCCIMNSHYIAWSNVRHRWAFCKR